MGGLGSLFFMVIIILLGMIAMLNNPVHEKKTREKIPLNLRSFYMSLLIGSFILVLIVLVVEHSFESKSLSSLIGKGIAYSSVFGVLIIITVTSFIGYYSSRTKNNKSIFKSLFLAFMTLIVGFYLSFQFA